ncbi:hypothetical protein JJB11_05995 [Ramlibacter ginsenosidimutans]|uniref:Uncharacterized protein n=1 Tax=Ramlibacter ginsenosidimutans TaxID=502333 RepID=A0A934TQH8_9BURK|nr:hypothetical protein [Ramlibacter ginsenosidimutans]MBK6005639.1 hypothetical protein [Ramlibacter ginsenosidimutans]
MHVDLTGLSALGGAGSAFIAAISYWWKTAHERRRATRTALFYLLELHHVLSRVRSASSWLKSNLGPSLKGSLHSRGIELNEEEFAASLSEAIPAFEQFGRLQIENSVAGISEGLSRSLVDLAKEDPLLAFRLRGRDQLLLMPQQLNDFVSRRAAEASAPSSDSSNWSGPEEFFSNVSLEELENAIRATASRCDLSTRIRTRALLRSAAEQLGGIDAVAKRVTDEFAASVAAKKV